MHILYRYFYCTASIPSHPVLPILPYPILSCPILSYPILSYPVLSCPTLPYPPFQLTLPHHIVLYLTPSPILYPHLNSRDYRTSPHHPGLRRPQGDFHDPPNTARVRDPAFHAAQAHQIQCERRGLCVCVCVYVCVCVCVCVLFIYDFHPRIQLLPSFLSPTYLSSFLLLPFFCFLLPSFFPLSYFLTFFFTSFLPLLASIVLFLTSLPPSLS